MNKIKIVSHLSPEEWKRSWNDKIVDESKRENVKATRLSDCYWGHFTSNNEFVLCFHKEAEAKGLSLGIYFWGKIDPDPQGCVITGKIGRKTTQNIFLIGGSVLMLLVLYASIISSSIQMIFVSAALVAILLIIYFVKPKRSQEILLSQLKKISFDDEFHKGGKKYKKTRKSKSTMKEKARALTEAEEFELEEQVQAQDETPDKADDGAENI